jgi:hypothetical protein
MAGRLSAVAEVAEPRIPRDIRQIKVDVTPYCGKLPKHVTAVHEVYVTDLSVRHFYCSAQALAYCIAVRAEFTVDDACPDDEREKIYEVESEYHFDDDYFDWRATAELPFVAFADDPDEDDDDSIMEAAREHFNGNHV